MLYHHTPDLKDFAQVTASERSWHGGSGVSVKVRDSGVQGEEFLGPSSSLEAQLLSLLPALTARPEAALDAARLLPGGRCDCSIRLLQRADEATWTCSTLWSTGSSRTAAP